MTPDEERQREEVRKRDVIVICGKCYDSLGTLQCWRVDDQLCLQDRRNRNEIEDRFVEPLPGMRNPRPVARVEEFIHDDGSWSITFHCRCGANPRYGGSTLLEMWQPGHPLMV